MQFLWHDYETFGTVPAVDRPCQFAAQRTDGALSPVGEPIVMYCAPADDVLPRPAACLVTGITPQLARREGKVEAEFAKAIHALMAVPGTCSAGYNNLRFDDEVSRNLFYRNLLDPYEREWKNGNSRWDLINLVRMCYALRPEGLEWPMVETASGLDDDEPSGNGSGVRPSFRLEDLAAANGVVQEKAHDALADVHATIGLAGRVREAQPRLFEWSLSLRDKKSARDLLDPEKSAPIVHTSGRLPAGRGCTSLVLPLANHPDYDKAVIVFDLMADAEPLVECDAEAIRDRVFTPVSDLPDGLERLPLKTVKWNAVPMVAPATVLAGVDCDRIGLDPERCERNADLLRRHIHTVRRNVQEAFHTEYEDDGVDPDHALYSGGFFNDSDRRLMRAIHACPPSELGDRSWTFKDKRLPLMLLRFRARNWPDTLSQSEWDAWQSDRVRRLSQPVDTPFYGLDAFRIDLAEARKSCAGNRDSQRILDALEAWSIELQREVHINDL